MSEHEDESMSADGVGRRFLMAMTWDSFRYIPSVEERGGSYDLDELGRAARVAAVYESVNPAEAGLRLLEQQPIGQLLATAYMRGRQSTAGEGRDQAEVLMVELERALAADDPAPILRALLTELATDWSMARGYMP